PKTQLAAAIERSGSSLVGVDAGELVGLDKNGVALSDNLEAELGKIDVLIDFSLPDSTEKNVQLCAEHKVAMVIGTTGLSEAQQKALDEACEQIPVVYAGNYS